MDENRLVRPGVVPNTGSATAREPEGLDLGRSHASKFEIAFFGCERDRKPSTAREGTAHRAALVMESEVNALIERECCRGFAPEVGHSSPKIDLWAHEHEIGVRIAVFRDESQFGLHVVDGPCPQIFGHDEAEKRAT
jgi:hypothetical protein